MITNTISRIRERQVRNRMALLRRMAAMDSPAIRALAQLIDGDPAKLWTALHARFRYHVNTMGPIAMTPTELLERGAGDAEDMAVVVAALLDAQGIKYRFRALRTSGMPTFHHLYVVATIDGKDLPIDLLAPRVGVEPGSGYRLDELAPLTAAGCAHLADSDFPADDLEEDPCPKCGLYYMNETTEQL